MDKRRLPKKTQNQMVWEYIRRNRNFRFGDIVMIIEIKPNTLAHYLRVLQLAGYIEPVNKSRKNMDRRYKLLINSGVKAPSIDVSHKILIDRNTGEKKEFRTRSYKSGIKERVLKAPSPFKIDDTKRFNRILNYIKARYKKSILSMKETCFELGLNSGAELSKLLYTDKLETLSVYNIAKYITIIG